ncbi:MAG: GPR endopeptidase [Eubacterium sp.]
MEAQEVLYGIVSATKPDCVLVIDALMAREADRLCTTVQITDTGITPGAGIGNKEAVLNEETLGAQFLP